MPAEFKSPKLRAFKHRISKLPLKTEVFRGYPIDVVNLSVGTNYNELKDSYIIFICMSDPFENGLPVYTFENIFIADGKVIKLGDRAFKVFFNAVESDKFMSEDERKFFDFLKGR